MTELVGLVPAAGHATRLGWLPMSKELYPLQAGAGASPRPAISWLLDGFVRAGVKRALVVLRAGKWDIPAALTVAGIGSALDLVYRVVEPTPGIVHTIAAGLPWLPDARIAFGFPDILFHPADALGIVAEHQERTGAAAVLGLVPADRPEKSDLVEVDARGRLRAIRIKPRGVRGRAHSTWMHAVWSPEFSGFLGDFVARPPARDSQSLGREVYPSDVFVAALQARLRIECVRIPGARYLDIGTPEDLARAQRFLARRR